MLDWLLKYPGTDYARGKLIFLGVWAGLGRRGSLVLLALLLGIGVALIALSTLRRVALLPGQRAALCTLQIAMLGLVALAIAQPALQLATLAAQQNTVAVLLDDSASMTLPGRGGTRLAEAHAVLTSDALGALARRYQLRNFVFAGSVQPVDDYHVLPLPGDRTAIGTAVLRVLQGLHGSALGALVVLSDGADSDGALSTEQLAQIASYGVPVHTVGVGPLRIPEDLELADVSLPTEALPGTSIVARVSVRHDGPGKTQVKVYDGDRFLASRDVSLDAQDGITSVPIALTLDQSGERELSFSLTPKPDEHELRNNSRQRMVQVLQQRASVLYVEGEPRWEYKFMRRALEDDPGVRLVSLLRTTTNGFYRQGVDSPDELRAGFPTDARTLDAYEGLIIGSVPAAGFSDAQLQMIHDFVSERGGSLLMVAGPDGLGDGGWGEDVVGQMLPAHLPDRVGSLNGGGASFHRERASIALTPAGRLSPMLQLADDPQRNQQQWDSLPPVEDYQDVGAPRLAATTLLSVHVGRALQPLLLTEPYGRGQTYLLATGGTWRWRMGLPSDDRRHQQFWRQLLHAMVASVPPAFELDARAVGDGIDVRAQLRDTAFHPIGDAGIDVQASSPTQTGHLTLRALPDQPGIYAGTWHPTGSGPVVLEASAQRGGQHIGSARASLEFTAGSEFFAIRQNRSLLQQLASATGGRYWSSSDLDGLPQAIGASNAGVLEQQLLPLWDAPLLFILLALLKSTEWVLRRRWGRI